MIYAKIHPKNFFTQDDVRVKVPMIIFSLVGGLIKSDRGKEDVRSDNDWTWYRKSIPNELVNIGVKMLVIDGYIGCTKSEDPLAIIKARIQNVANRLPDCLDIMYLIYTKDDTYPPPKIGIINFIQNYANASIELDRSYVCGDLGGELCCDSYARCGDADMQYANALGIRYISPGKLFSTSKVPSSYKEDGQEVIICVGQYGSGIESFSWMMINLYDYVCVWDDTPNDVIELALLNGSSVIISRNNPRRKDRETLISLLCGLKIASSVRVIWFTDSGVSNGAQSREYSDAFESPTNDHLSERYLEILD